MSQPESFLPPDEPVVDIEFPLDVSEQTGEAFLTIMNGFFAEEDVPTAVIDPDTGRIRANQRLVFGSLNKNGDYLSITRFSPEEFSLHMRRGYIDPRDRTIQHETTKITTSITSPSSPVEIVYREPGEEPVGPMIDPKRKFGRWSGRETMIPTLAEQEANLTMCIWDAREIIKEHTTVRGKFRRVARSLGTIANSRDS